MHFAYPPESLREFDRRMTACGQLEPLMREAGHHVAQAAKTLRAQRDDAPSALFLVGKGNNGGDALVAAKLLFAEGWRVRLLLAAPPEQFSELSARQWQSLPAELRQNARVATALLTSLDFSDGLLIDGLLGTGFNDELPREPVATLIRLANASHLPILAIDIPSGLNGDTGEAECCIQATATVCLCAVKTGLLRGQGVAAAGRLISAPLPGADVLAALPRGPAVFGKADARERLPRIAFDAHKFQRGMVTVLGGSRQYGGAPVLAATAALRAGAGLAQLLLPQGAELFCEAPKALIVQRLPDRGEGVLNAAALPALATALDRSAAVAFGPGVTRIPAILPVLAEILGAPKPLVLDADALNLLATAPALLASCRAAATVLTPHAGEFARLQAAYGLEPTDDRAYAAAALAKRTGAVVVLKGARTIVASPDGDYSYNLSGCPALATAGSGDVLTGVIAALLANGLSAYDAARLGVWLHGAAAEHATRPAAPLGLIADDLPALIQATLASLY